MEREQLVRLVTQAQSGDSQALNELFNAFYNDVYYFALKTVKDGDLACDITQEAFVEIINTLHNLKEPAAFVTWMKQITYHQCTRYFKKKKDVLVDENEDGETIFDTVKEDNADFIPDEALDKDDFKKTILGILDELSEEQRSATMLYYFDELSVKQIAEIQGVSEGTVKSRLNYARKAIKASVEEYEKKNGIKLHAFPFFPLVHWVLEGGAEALPFAAAETVAGGITAATGTTVSVTTASTAAGASVTAATTAATATVATTAATATGIGAKLAALPIVTKIIAGITAAVIAVGAGTAAVIISNNNDDTPASGSNASSSLVSSNNELTGGYGGAEGDEYPESWEKNADDYYARVFLGEYEQDGNTDNGAEPIEWYVGADYSDRVLLLSKYCIEYMPFDENGNGVWSESSVRSFLNGSFYNEAFTDDERSMIQLHEQQTTVQDPDSDPAVDGYYTETTVTTKDRVFLMSSWSEGSFIWNNGIACAEPTPYAKSKIEGETFGNTVCWFERNADTMITSDTPNKCILTFVETGSTHVHGIPADQACGIRPAIWVDASIMENAIIPAVFD